MMFSTYTKTQTIVVTLLLSFALVGSLMSEAFAAPKWHELRVLDFPIQVKQLDFSKGKFAGKTFPKGKLSRASEYCFGSWCARFTSDSVVARAWPRGSEGLRASGEYILVFSIADKLECTNAIEGTRDCELSFQFHRASSGLDPDCQINIVGVGAQTFKCPKKIVFE